MSKWRAAALSLAALLPAGLAQPQDQASREAGIPFIRWFSPQEYEGSQQVWSFVQDDSGIVYAGLSNGLRQYDGTSWRAIATPHNAPVRGLARGPEGRIFVGEVGDFGYLQPNATGEMAFQSMLEFVPAGDRDFQDVRKVHPMPEGIYFQSLERLFLLTREGSGWKAKVWRPSTRFRNSFAVNDTLYLTVTNEGLYRMKDGAIERLPAQGLEQSPETLVTALLPFASSRDVLVGTGDGRLQLLDENGLKPFPGGGEPLRKLGISGAGAVSLVDGGIGIGTRGGGLLVLERDGQLRYHLDRAAGIPSDGVLALYRDREGTVWVGLQNGIARVELASPFSQFGRPAGMSGAVNAIVRYRGLLHVATFAGLKYLDPATREFRMVQGLETSGVVGILVHGDRLLAAVGRDGLFEVKGDKATSVNKGAFSAVLAHSRQNPARVWVGTRAGLLAMREGAAGHWIDEGMVATTPEIRSIVEPEPGLLWLGTQARGVVRLKLRGDSLSQPEVKAFGPADGLPGSGGVSVHQVAGRVVFTSPEGAREFDAASGRFVPSPTLGMIPTGGSAEEFSVVTGPNGGVWANLGVRPVYLGLQENGSYAADEGRLRRIGDGRVYAMAVDADGVVWLGGLDSVFRYDPAKVRPGGDPRPALIRRVTAGRNLLHAGSGAAPVSPPRVRYRDQLRFEYAVASLDDPAKNRFQSQLEGFDPDWSGWNGETRRDYTNLPPGSYVFRVRARDLTGQEGAEASYPIQILPPWYRTWWAFVLYGLVGLGLLIGADRIQRARVLAREREASVLREAQLRAETAAAEAKTLQAENERNKNVQLLSEIGKDLTSSLDLNTIFLRLYEHVNQLTDATIFGVAIYHEQRHELEYRLALENGKRYPLYTRDTRKPNQLPVWCIEYKKRVVLNDVANEYSRYIEVYDEPLLRLEDGSESRPAASVIYLPLMMKDRVLGVITAQSYKKNAYTDYHVDVLENLASYTAIALDNADAYLNLKAVQDQLVVQEKLASLGALTAGIAHEIKNPLNFVNNFADMSVELMEELREEVGKFRDGAQPDLDNMEDLLDDLSSNARKIHEHGKRADGIVKSMLLHSRGGAGERQMIDINAMIDENVNLSYHGMRAQDSGFNVTIDRQLAADAGKLDGIPQDLSRVFLNILNNACYAVNEKLKKVGQSYSPVLRVQTLNLGDTVEVRLRDNGPGIPPEVRAKIFNPFFTTKPTGEGTGLGLSISHDIVVQEHGGQLEVETAPGEFTEFIVRLPRYWRKSG
ncbi:MAG: ATP-binding protein [Bryobacteraceae bacterium]